MNLNELRDKAYQCAVAHGWHEENLSDEHFLCLIVGELMKAVETDRKGRLGKKCKSRFEMDYNRYIVLVEEEEEKRFKCSFEKNVKDTLPDELTDAVILLLDLAGLRNFNLNRFSPVDVVSRKKTFTENIYAIVKEIMDRKYSLEEQVNYVITQVFALADILSVDLLWHINQKMRYNEVERKKILIMKTIIFTIICIIALLWVGDLTITFKPFSISLPGWYKPVGIILFVLAMAVYNIGEYAKGYKHGFDDGIKNVLKYLKRNALNGKYSSMKAPN